jgi:hypothetical protein
MAEQKYLRITTPKGTFRYPFVKAPDTRFNKDGVYKVDFLLTEEAAAPLMEQLDKLNKENFEKVQSELKPIKQKTLKMATPYAPDADDDGNETGLIKIKPKMNSQFKGKDGAMVSMRPAVFDSKGAPIENIPLIGNGSEGKVNFTPMPYYNPKDNVCGLSIRLNGIQIIKLIPYSAQSASAMGFNSEEGEGGFDSANSSGNSGKEPGEDF